MTYLTVTGELVVALGEWGLHAVTVQVPASSVGASKYHFKSSKYHFI